MRVTVGLLMLMTSVCAAAQERPKVAILATGGTIASKQDPAKRGLRACAFG
jgi:L-asparaginase/Glu-tRNA(Gln) amidotransferase subunit D